MADKKDERRNILVTGGSRGVGLAVAARLAKDGFRVIALARKPSAALDTAINAASGGALHFKAFDLSLLDAIPDLVRDLKKEFGPLYGLVNNAALGTEGLLSNMHVKQIEEVVRVNTVSPIVLTKHAVRGMMTADEGRIVNISSIIGSTGYSGLSVYGATKASMIGFTKSLAREVGRMNITVNAVAPGFMDTDMTQSLNDGHRAQIARRSALQRLVDVEDVASAISFLMSDAARNITGTVMTVDAGNTA
jgi:3-oxoacyl-[acyl-carrier protein] reductase